VLRRYLRDQGFAPHPWLLGMNRGPVGDLRKKLVTRVVELSERYNEPISIVGWSLGGIYARELAKAEPDRVRQVISLGSPFANTGRRSNASALYRCFAKNNASVSKDQASASLRTPPSVPSTAIFSRTDGVVHWSTCLEPITNHTDNIEVPGSHCGLGINPLVLYAVSDRLSQPIGAWKPFDRTGWRAHLYGGAPPRSTQLEPIWPYCWCPRKPTRGRSRALATRPSTCGFPRRFPTGSTHLLRCRALRF
jgi:pimeloyl-ACP methyl ester carboxylesterase